MRTDEQKKNLIEWAEALESGEYPQTRGKLQRTAVGIAGSPPGMCCLGGCLCNRQATDSTREWLYEVFL